MYIAVLAIVQDCFLQTFMKGCTITPNMHLYHRGEKERMVSVHDKHLLAGIKALCRGSGALHRADQTALTAAMKAAKLPPHIKTVAPGTPPPTGLL